MFKCDLCNKSFSSLRGMYQHYFKAHNLICKIYYDKFIRKSGEGICPICGKETTFTNGTIGYTKYCSCKCATNDENYKQNKINMLKPNTVKIILKNLEKIKIIKYILEKHTSIRIGEMVLFQIPNKDNPMPQVFKCLDFSKYIADYLKK